MRRSGIFVLLLLALIAGQTVFAQTEQKRIERLAGLARTWGTVKFFHPYLGYRKIDWDKALIETIPKVNAARSAEDYRSAVNSMLAVLGDPATVAAIPAEPAKSSPSPPATATAGSDAVTLVDGVLLIKLIDASRIITSDRSQYRNVMKQISDLLPKAKAAVIDCRPPRIANAYLGVSDYLMENFLETALARLVAGNQPLSTIRYRVHNGYAPQTGSTSGGYTSSVVMDAPGVIAGNAQKQLPLAFIVNDDAPDIAKWTGGLRAAGIAKVIQEGPMSKRPGADAHNISLPDGVTVKMATTELLNPDGTVGFATDTTIPVDNDTELKRVMVGFVEPTPSAARPIAEPGALAPVDLKDNSYPEMRLPTKEYRLLGLFRFWSVIDNFFPYHDLLDDSWKTVLERHIPKFEAARSAIEYQTAVSELLTEIHDSHGFVAGADEMDEQIGNFMPPLFLRYVGDEAVIDKRLGDEAPVKTGDVIVSIDGRPEKEVRGEIGRRVTASTTQSFLFLMTGELLRGQKDTVVKLGLRGLDGKVRTVAIARSLSMYDPKLAAEFKRKTPVVSVLPEGFGYVDLGRLQTTEVDDMFTKIKDTKAVIFDMRGYPNSTAWLIAPRLTEKVKPEAALFTRPIVSARTVGGDVNQLSFKQTFPERTGDIYKGKVVMLIDESAGSQSEHTCLFFETATDVTFIGTPTTGANGDVTRLVLPGGLVVSFTGQAVKHVDGRQLQRLGIQPTIRAAPSINGVAEGRDEVLAAAVKYLKKTIKK
jgi:C-terminal processing protease CtpA/Prc